MATNILYSGTPPTPTALTSAEIALLRNELLEPTIQVLGAALARTGPMSALTTLNSGVTLSSDPLTNNGWHKILIPATVWTTAAQTQVLTVGTIPAKTRVVGCYLDVTEAYAGLAGTIALKLGHATDDDFLLVSADVKTATVTLGLADADMGVGLTIAASIQNSSLPSWTATKGLILTMTSGTGNIGAAGVTLLSAGISYLYIKLETLP